MPMWTHSFGGRHTPGRRRSARSGGFHSVPGRFFSRPICAPQCAGFGGRATVTVGAAGTTGRGAAVGGSGVSADRTPSGVTGFEAAEAEPLPTLLVAVTVNV